MNTQGDQNVHIVHDKHLNNLHLDCWLKLPRLIYSQFPKNRLTSEFADNLPLNAHARLHGLSKCDVRVDPPSAGCLDKITAAAAPGLWFPVILWSGSLPTAAQPSPALPTTSFISINEVSRVELPTNFRKSFLLLESAFLLLHRIYSVSIYSCSEKGSGDFPNYAAGKITHPFFTGWINTDSINALFSSFTLKNLC